MWQLSMCLHTDSFSSLKFFNLWTEQGFDMYINSTVIKAF